MTALQLGVAAYLVVGVIISVVMFRDVMRSVYRPFPVRGTARVVLRCAYLALFWLPDFAWFCWTDRRG